MTRAIGFVASIWLGLNACSPAAVLDLIFLLDGSSSVGSSGYANAKAFASSITTTGISSETNVAVIHYGATATTAHSLSDDQTRSVITTTIDGLTFPNSTDGFINGLNATLSHFDSEGGAGNNRLLFFITDGSIASLTFEQQQAFKESLDNAGIVTAVIGVGSGWNPSPVTWMVDDTDVQIIEATSFTSGNMNALLALVPEPGTPMLFAVAGTLLLLRRKRSTACA